MSNAFANAHPMAFESKVLELADLGDGWCKMDPSGTVAGADADPIELESKVAEDSGNCDELYVCFDVRRSIEDVSFDVFAPLGSDSK